MNTKIINLSGVLFEGEAKALNARTVSGEITILDHHKPIISVLTDNSRIWLDEAGAGNKRHEFATPSGFLHLDGNNHLTVLID
jgi:F0F1-type ATP synthase epsilon subunit